MRTVIADMSVAFGTDGIEAAMAQAVEVAGEGVIALEARASSSSAWTSVSSTASR